MTNRLYYNDSYLTQFEAVSCASLTYQGQPAIILDQTAFYPTGGGQPHDLGRLNDLPVLDVVADPDTGQIIHVLAQPLQAEAVVGKIDWSHRFDLMQQHSGQHILSQAILKTTDAATIGFHLSQDYATIDIARSDLDLADLQTAETLANDIIYDNRPITARFVTETELADLPLRKQPTVTGPIRIVTVQAFDWSACGGTHVAQTGEIGLIKIVKQERRNKFLRLTFLCGRRAWRDYDQINRQIREMALHLSVSVEEAFAALQRQSEDLKQAQKEIDRLKADQLTQEATTLITQAVPIGPISLIQHLYENRPITEIRRVAQQITQQPNCVALLGLKAKKGQLVFARSTDLTVDMGALLRTVCHSVGGGGGGSPALAQGGGLEPEKVIEALALAQRDLKSSLAQSG